MIRSFALAAGRVTAPHRFGCRLGYARALVLASLLGMALPASVSAQENAQPPNAQALVHAANPNLREIARGVPSGGKLAVDAVEIQGLGTRALDLDRFEVFAPDAQIVADAGNVLARPATAYFRGTLTGEPESAAVLVVPESGPPRGLIRARAGLWFVGEAQQPARPGVAGRRVAEAALARLPALQCGSDRLPLTARSLAGPSAPAEPQAVAAVDQAASYTAAVAVETDYEFFRLFGDTAAATDYVGDLFAYASGIYAREIGTNLSVSYLRLWTASNDPWTESSDTYNALTEFQDYWISNRGSVNRALAVMLSGKDMGGGIAYVNALCSNSQGYALATSIGGNFNIDNPAVVWDIVVVTHEIGHVFGSWHSHCYEDTYLPGSTTPEPEAIDHCWGSETVSPSARDVYGQPVNCWSGSTSLPGVQATSGGITSNHPGTIMSYCHQRTGGYSNLALTFGDQPSASYPSIPYHPFGVRADRVPALMRTAVQAYGSCLLPSAGPHTLSVSKSGSGGGTVTSNPAGIDCGAICSAAYDAGTAVTLTAAPAVGSVFAGWSGACTGTGSCAVTLSGPKTVTATFNPSGGGTGLAEAVDNLGLSFTTGGNAGWVSQTTTTYFGGDAAKSGVITHSQTSWMETTVSGPGTLSFYWRVSSESNYDFLRFYLDGVEQSGRISGTVNWTRKSLAIGPGSHTLRWAYTKDGSVSSGSDAGWVDQVVFTGGGASYTLSVGKSGSGSGTVTGSPAGIDCGATCSAAYTSGTSVTLTPAAAVGSVFAGWSGACTGTGSCVVTMDGAKSVTATFDPAPITSYTLSVGKSGSGSGTVTSSPAGIDCGATCSAAYTSGTSVTLTPAAAVGSVFAGWSGACTGTGGCVVTMDGAKSVTATFDPAPITTYTLSVGKSGSGSGTVTSSPVGIDCGATCSAAYTSGTSVTLTPAAAVGSVFAGWSGACTGTGSCVVTMDGAKSVTATFNASGGGTGLAEAVDNLGLSFTTGGNAGWVSQTTTTYFGGDAAKSGVITHSQTSWMETTVSGPGTLSFYWRVSSESNYDFLRFYLDGVEQSGRISGTVNWTQKSLAVGAGSHTLRWAYTKDGSVSSGSDAGWVDQVVFTGGAASYTLSVGKSGSGSGTVTGSPAGIDCGATCSAAYTSGTSVTLTPAAAVGSVFAGWSGACTGTGSCVVTMDGAKSVTATFNASGGDGGLAGAIDQVSWVVTTGGNAGWVSQTTTTSDGVDAAKSGVITHSQTSWMETTVSGPGTLSFYWRVSSESNYDFLRFYLDGVEQSGRISGTVNWTQKSFAIGAGSHTLRWAYTKDGSVSSGSDAAWVDRVGLVGP